MKQNSTKNMMLRHLKDIKAKIEQKGIHNMKLPFEGPYKNKYAGRLPDRGRAKSPYRDTTTSICNKTFFCRNCIFGMFIFRMYCFVPRFLFIIL